MYLMIVFTDSNNDEMKNNPFEMHNVGKVS